MNHKINIVWRISAVMTLISAAFQILAAVMAGAGICNVISNQRPDVVLYIAVFAACLFTINGLIQLAAGILALNGKSFAGIILGFANLIIVLYCMQITGFSIASLVLLIVPTAYLIGAFIQDRQDQAGFSMA